jgi:hypothetical protein
VARVPQLRPNLPRPAQSPGEFFTVRVTTAHPFGYGPRSQTAKSAGRRSLARSCGSGRRHRSLTLAVPADTPAQQIRPGRTASVLRRRPQPAGDRQEIAG